MAWRNIGVRLEANVRGYQAQLAAASASTKKFAGTVQESAAKGNQAVKGAAKAFAVLGVAVLAAATLSVRAAAQYERALHNVGTISQGVADDIRGTGDQLLKLSRQLPQSAVTLAEGLYDIASSGFQGAEGMRVLGASAAAASAGLTTTEVAARGITAALNAYGIEAADVGDVSDILFQTVNLGVVTFEELASSLGDFVGTAASANVPLDEASAALATMTLSGISAAEASTSLNRLLQAMIDPTDEARAAFEELGINLSDLQNPAIGLRGVMTQVKNSVAEATAAGGSQVEMLLRLYPEIRAARGALALLANEGQNYAAVAAGIIDQDKRAGSTQRALAEQSKALTYQLQLLRNMGTEVGIRVGTVLIPPVKSAVAFFRDLTGGVLSLNGPFKAFLGIATGAGGVLFGLAGAFLLLAPRIQAARQLYISLGGAASTAGRAMRAMTLAAGGIGLALTIAAGILAVYGQRKREVTEATDRHVQALRNEQDGLAGANAEMVANLIGHEKLADLADKAHVPLETVISALLGEADAIAEVNRARTEAEDWQLRNNKSMGEGLTLTKETFEYVDRQKSARRELGSIIERETKARGNANREIRNQVEAQESARLKAEREAAAQERLRSAFEKLNLPMRAVTDKTKALQEARDGLNLRQAAGVQVTAEDRKALSELETQMGQTGEATVKLSDAQKALNKGLSTFAEPMRIYREQLDLVNEAARTSAEKQAKATKDTKDTWEKYYKEAATLPLKSFAVALEQNNRDAETWKRNLDLVASRVGSDVARHLASLGKEATPIVKQFATGAEADVQRAAEAMRQSLSYETDQAAMEMDARFVTMEQIAGAGSAAVVTAITTRLAAGQNIVADIATKYGANLAAGINPVLADLGLPLVTVPTSGGPRAGGERAMGSKYANGGLVRFYADGGAEHHVAQVAPAGAWRVWAEPETGGEAYIPLAKSKRQRSMAILAKVAEEFGMGLMDYADGGFLSRSDVPPPPGFDPYGWGTGNSARSGTAAAFENVAKFVEKYAGPTGDIVAVGRWLQSKGFRVSEHPAFGGVRGRHTPSSYHYAGRAIDVNYGPGGQSAGEMAAIDALMPTLQRRNWAELLWRVAGHFDHLHLALSRGALLGKVLSYDQGGLLPPGLSMTYNGTGRPEPVGSPRDLERAFERALNRTLGRMPRGVEKLIVTPKNDVAPRELSRMIGWELR